MSTSRALIFLAAVSLLFTFQLPASGNRDNSTVSGQSGTDLPSGSPQSGSGGTGSGGNGPGGNGPGGNGPGGSGGQSPMGKPPGSDRELESKDSSDYFSDLNVTTVHINAYVDYLVERGIITADKKDGLYRPWDNLTHSELAAMLDRLYPTEKVAYIRDDKPVTREQMALWIYESEIRKGMPKEMTTDDVSIYKDGDSISDKARKAVGTLSRMRLFVAENNGDFNPGGTVTRAEIPLILYKLSFFGAPGGNPPGGSASGGNPPGGNPPGSGAPGGNGPGAPPMGGNDSIDHGTYAALVDKDQTGKTYSSTGDGENALRIEKGAAVSLSHISVSKSAGSAGSGDSSNFYGSNAGILVMDKASVTIDNSTVETTARGANGIFSYGEGTSVTVKNTKIRTLEGSSGAIMVAGGGSMQVLDSDFETKGDSAAALRTDRGGGTLKVQGGRYVSHGKGSPAIYCTANVSVSDAELTSTSSEAVVVEGLNSVVLNNCTVSGAMVKNNAENLQNVMIYQSMSGDAESGRGSFVMTGGSLESKNGDMFYTTNTDSYIRLEHVKLTLSNGVLLRASGNDARNGWGRKGQNGAQCQFEAVNQQLSGNVAVDSISSLDLYLKSGTVYKGAIQGDGKVSVVLDSKSRWILSGDSHISSLSGSSESVETNGFKLYINGKIQN